MSEEVAEALARLEDAVTRRFDSVDRALRNIDERLTLIEDKLDRASGVRFDTDRLLTGFARLKQRLDDLEAKGS
jgi:hypothetical protein